MFNAVYFSPWPLSIGVSSLGLILGLWYALHSRFILLIFSFLLIVLLSFLWIDDLNKEVGRGYISRTETILRKYGFLFFITREVILFFSLFWCFFHSRLVACVQSGGVWPPIGIRLIPCFGVPLVNTVLLLLRGVSLTWSHATRRANKYSRIGALLITIALGITFLFLQVEEYSTSSFCFSDRVYGRIFYLSTGFHGVHVLFGVTALIYALINKSMVTYAPSSVAFLFSAWYWHFVDVVWLFLFLFVYWWGGL